MPRRHDEGDGERGKIVRKNIWMSYDLGFNGDYENLYAWLDNQDALECGDSVAFLSIDVEENENVFEAIKESLKADVKFDTKSRIYVIARHDGRMRARFVIGNRKKSPPWSGYGVHDVQEEDVLS